MIKGYPNKFGFERGQDPMTAMDIGVDAKLKELGCRFAHTRLGEPIFVKGEDPDTTISVRPLNWNSKQLRAIADYLDAHPEATKIIDIIEDKSNFSNFDSAMQPKMGIPWTNPPIPDEDPIPVDLSWRKDPSI